VVDVDPESVQLRLDDDEPITGTSLRVDTRALDEEVPHAIFASSGSLHVRVDFTVTHTAPDPIAGTVDVFADSITWQAADMKTPTALAELPEGNKVFSYPGLTASNYFGTGSEEANLGRADVDIIALGNNDATWDGWDQTDVENFQTLVGLASVKTCVALMLPGYSAAFSPEGQVMLDLARDGVRGIANDRAATGSPTVIVDWQAYIDADPSIIAADGLHLASEGPNHEGPVLEHARQARISALLEGIDACTAFREQNPDPEDDPQMPGPDTLTVIVPVPEPIPKILAPA